MLKILWLCSFFVDTVYRRRRQYVQRAACKRNNTYTVTQKVTLLFSLLTSLIQLVCVISVKQN